MSKDRIKETAVRHFNRYGYEGVRMAQIAEEAGIRKQSLSYHYATKRVLLEELYGEVVQEEIAFLCGYFASTLGHPWDERLYQFLVEHKNRFLSNPNAHFMFMLSYFTPAESHDYIGKEFLRYLSALKEEVAQVFTLAQPMRMTSEECTIAYTTLMDGLDVQLVYESAQAYEKVLAIGWKALLHGIAPA